MLTPHPVVGLVHEDADEEDMDEVEHDQGHRERLHDAQGKVPQFDGLAVHPSSPRPLARLCHASAGGQTLRDEVPPVSGALLDSWAFAAEAGHVHVHRALVLTSLRGVLAARLSKPPSRARLNQAMAWAG